MLNPQPGGPDFPSQLRPLSNIMCDIFSIESPVHTSVVNTVDQKPSTGEKNGLPDADLNVQPPPSKVQDIISIGSR